MIRLLAGRAVRSGLIWGLVFGAVVASSITQFTTAYDTPQSRHAIATTVGGNGALRALFGSGRALETVAGWTAWRSLGIVTILGPGQFSGVLAIAIINMPVSSRLVRAVTVSARNADYVEAARALGCSDWRLMECSSKQG